MSDARWHCFADADAAAGAAVALAADAVAATLADRGRALVALPGGRSPRAALERLAAADLDWRRVTVIPTDDRQVLPGDPLSNADMLEAVFAPRGARVVRITGGGAPSVPDDAWPLDLAWLGMGADGHTASIFPGPDYDRALDAEPPTRLVPLTPDPLPPEAPVARVTLTRAAIAEARRVMLTVAGDAKRAVLEQALAEGASSPYPVGRVLASLARPADILWSPA